MSPERACIAISLVIALAVNALETMQTRFALLGFKSWQIHFEIRFVTTY